MNDCFLYFKCLQTRHRSNTNCSELGWESGGKKDANRWSYFTTEYFIYTNANNKNLFWKRALALALGPVSVSLFFCCYTSPFVLVVAIWLLFVTVLQEPKFSLLHSVIWHFCYAWDSVTYVWQYWIFMHKSPFSSSNIATDAPARFPLYYRLCSYIIAIYSLMALMDI